MWGYQYGIKICAGSKWIERKKGDEEKDKEVRPNYQPPSSIVLIVLVEVIRITITPTEIIVIPIRLVPEVVIVELAVLWLVYQVFRRGEDYALGDALPRLLRHLTRTGVVLGPAVAVHNGGVDV